MESIAKPRSAAAKSLENNKVRQLTAPAPHRLRAVDEHVDDLIVFIECSHQNAVVGRSDYCRKLQSGSDWLKVVVNSTCR